MNLKETLEYMNEDAQSNNTQITTKSQAGNSNNSKEYLKIVNTFDTRINDIKKLYQMINELTSAIKADNIQITPELNQQLQTLNNNYTSLVKTYEDNKGLKTQLKNFIKNNGQGEKVETTEADKKAKQMRQKAIASKKVDNGTTLAIDAPKAESQNQKPTA